VNAARALLWLAFGLALVVVGASSGLRLAANGLGCEPWPTCYGSPAAAAVVKQSATAQAARLTHRIAASAFVIAVLGGVLLGWRAWSKPARAAALLDRTSTCVDGRRAGCCTRCCCWRWRRRPAA
jgi:heme A synthase